MMLAKFTNMKSSISDLRGGADAAMLLVNDLNHCGISYLDSIATGETVSVCRKNCASGFYSVGHVIGHNFGLTHESGHLIQRANNTADGTVHYNTGGTDYFYAGLASGSNNYRLYNRIRKVEQYII